MKLKNSRIFDRKFNESFINLSKIKNLDATTKFNLVKLRRDIVSVIEIIKESMTDLNYEQKSELMRQENEYKFDTIDPKKVIEQLTADDLFNLEPLLTKEEL